MWRMSQAARDQLAASHTMVSRVEVLHSGKPVYTLQAVSGSVSTEAARPVRRNLTCTVTDPTGALSGGDIDDLLNPYLCEIAPHRGVRLPVLTSAAGRFEMVPQGVFGLTSREVSGDGTVSLTGQDRAMNYQGPMSSALAIAAGTPIESAIIRLLATRNPGVTLSALQSGFTCGPLLYAPDIDVWAEARQLAASVGGQLFHNRTGQPVFSLTGPASLTPAAVYAEGDGRLLGVDRAEDSDTIRNVVVAESPSGLIRAVAEDTDPTSPTYVNGRFGRRPVTVVNQHFWSIQQAQQAATARLSYELGRSETATFDAVPDPALDVDDLVVVHRPRAGLVRRGLAVAAIDLPLAAGGSMRVGCRRSVLAPDGQVLPVEELTAA